MKPVFIIEIKSSVLSLGTELWETLKNFEVKLNFSDNGSLNNKGMTIFIFRNFEVKLNFSDNGSLNNKGMTIFQYQLRARPLIAGN